MAVSRVYLPTTCKRELCWGEVRGSQLLTSEKGYWFVWHKSQRWPPFLYIILLASAFPTYRVMFMSNVGMTYMINPAVKRGEILKMVLFNHYPRNQAEGILISLVPSATSTLCPSGVTRPFLNSNQGFFSILQPKLPYYHNTLNIFM